MAMSKAISIMRPNTGLGQLFYHTYNMIQRTMKYEHYLGPMRILFPKMEEALLGREPQKREETDYLEQSLNALQILYPRLYVGVVLFAIQ